MLVGGQVVGTARDARVHRRAAQLLLVGVLADRHLHQRRAAEEDPGPSLHEDRVVAHARAGRRRRRWTTRRPRRSVGMPAADSWVSRRNWAPPGTKTSAWRGRSAPPDSTRITSGQAVGLGHVHGPQQLAMVVGLVVPPRTVGSLADRPGTGCPTPRPGPPPARPPAGRRSPRPASGESSSTGVPGSTSASRRSAGEQLAPGQVALDVALATASEDLVAQGPRPRPAAPPWPPGWPRTPRPGIEVAGRRCPPAAGERRWAAGDGHRSATHEGDASPRRRPCPRRRRRRRTASADSPAAPCHRLVPVLPGPPRRAAWCGRWPPATSARSASMTSSTQSSSSRASTVAVSRPAARASWALKDSPVRA